MGFEAQVGLITGLLGGLALFLYGMKVMSDSLSQLAGDKLEGIIDKITNSKLKAWIFGVFVTAIIQSSSATTVLTVGLVNSGIMKLQQAVGVIIGANLGTTATAWILSLNGIEAGASLLFLFKPSTFAPVIAIAAALILMFNKSEKLNRVAVILIGFSVMMMGMTIMGSSVVPLRNSEGFRLMMTTRHNSLFAYVIALLFTMLIQSSDATIGILEALAISVGVDVEVAIPIILGSQVGTCITALVSSAGVNRNGRRAALIHLYYNLAKTLPIMIIISIIKGVSHPPFFDQQASVLFIILIHSGVNVIGSLFFLPLSNILLKLAEWTVPFTEEEKKEKALIMLDPIFLKNPSYALEQANKASLILCDTVKEGCDLLGSSYDSWNKEAETGILAICDRVESFKNQTVKYLNNIQRSLKRDKEAKRTTLQISTCVYFGDISNRIRNIALIFKEHDLEHRSFSTEALNDLKLYGSAIKELMEILETELYKQSTNIPYTVHLYVEMLSDFYSQIKLRQIRRLDSNIIDPQSSSIYSGILFEMQSIVDVCDIIAKSFEDALGVDMRTMSAEEKKEKDSKIKKLFEDKYGRLSEEDVYGEIVLTEENKNK
ncbi:MAG: Na/Pi symporter [Lachnospiraceae bacterium]|nr:Na/Pi symporter [Lachnospiraceae bacterium]